MIQTYSTRRSAIFQQYPQGQNPPGVHLRPVRDPVRAKTFPPSLPRSAASGPRRRGHAARSRRGRGGGRTGSAPTSFSPPSPPPLPTGRSQRDKGAVSKGLPTRHLVRGDYTETGRQHKPHDATPSSPSRIHRTVFPAPFTGALTYGCAKNRALTAHQLLPPLVLKDATHGLSREDDAAAGFGLA